MCENVSEILNKGIIKSITINAALRCPLPMGKVYMFVNVCKSVSECVEQKYGGIYYNESNVKAAIAIGEIINMCKCV